MTVDQLDALQAVVDHYFGHCHMQRHPGNIRHQQALGLGVDLQARIGIKGRTPFGGQRIQFRVVVEITIGPAVCREIDAQQIRVIPVVTGQNNVIIATAGR